MYLMLHPNCSFFDLDSTINTDNTTHAFSLQEQIRKTYLVYHLINDSSSDISLSDIYIYKYFFKKKTPLGFVLCKH
jgi:hypothetical protein